MKYFNKLHYISNDGNFDIYINSYTTKSGNLKFHIEIFAEHLHNNNGFCSRIASYRTSENEMLHFLRCCDYFKLISES